MNARSRGRHGHIGSRQRLVRVGRTVPGRRSRSGRATPGVRRVLAGAVGFLVVLVLAALLLGTSEDNAAALTVARHIVYTAPTANESSIIFPDEVWAQLRDIGLRHERIAVTRVDSTGEAETTIVDLTPRAGGSPDGPPLKVPERAGEAVDASIAALEARMNASPASSGGRALFAGLTKISFSGAPVTIVSSGLDLAKPVDFRTLSWSVAPEQVVAAVSRPGELPDLGGAPVTFVVVPGASAQQQLRGAQKSYRNGVWTALLTAGHASSVSFIDATATGAASATSAPVVDVPDLPDTPVRSVPDPADANRMICSLPSSTYFKVDEAVLLDRARTIRDLQPCIGAALAAGASIELDGWTSYEGPLTTEGKPAVDDPVNRTLSSMRVQTIADLLVAEMNVPRRAITRLTGHGNIGQPYPDPRSSANRLVVVSYRTK